ncbi:MAG TPA: hypothetical protein PLG09_03895 [Syntrophomonadaceae bacterium]|nr:hypothetical protein [Syntrophomonadaceae bacterium]
MEKSAKLTYTLIETAVDKGIRDIRGDTRRGIRNLVDLASHLTQGLLLQHFFQIVQRMLADNNSSLYEFTSNVIEHVDHQVLKNVAVKLVYTCCTYGYQQMQKCEQEHGHLVPRTLVFDFREEYPDSLTQEEISQLISDGETIGIYCGVFLMNGDQQRVTDLVEGLAQHKDGVYFLLAPPEAISPSIAQMVVNSKNIVPVIRLQAEADYHHYLTAVNILFDHKCLFATYSEYDDDNLADLISDDCLDLIEEARGFAYFMVRSRNFTQPDNLQLITDFLAETRAVPRYPFLIIDLYADLMEYANYELNYFMAIRSDGTITTRITGGLLPQYNIRTHSLPSIMEQVMPKLSD